MEKSKKRPKYREFKGLLLNPYFSKEGVESAINYKSKPNDIFVVTFPKCGTTWMQHIIMSIIRKGKPFADAMDFFNNTPFLEMAGADAADRMRRPGAIKTHLPSHLLPFSSNTKYIYVARNPKDCCVSFYYHTKHLPAYLFQDGTFDDYFDIFVKGEGDSGDYFEHLIPWYERRNESNVYFTTFENLKMDTRKEILNVAKFIDDEYETMLLENRKILDDVLYYTSFEYMQGEVNSYHGELFQYLLNDDNEKILPCGFKALRKELKQAEMTHSSPYKHIRKGIIGDWKNHFSSEQVKIMDQRSKEKTTGSDVMTLWDGI